ncbi:MAG: hypothetical protein MCM46_00210 [Candidatus Manganitrophus sp. SB1]|nr:hypothetical protein [Candidatus Manganitrophus morganii]
MMRSKGLGRFIKSLNLILCLLSLIGLSGASDVLSQPVQEAPSSEADLRQIPIEKLIRLGQNVIFGTDNLKGVFDKREAIPIGRGQCPLCHSFFVEQKAERCPNMIALSTQPQKLLQVSIEERSHDRIKDPRYAEAKQNYAQGERNTGIVPHAETGGQYLIESQYCPDCYVVEGYGIKGTNDMASPMPAIHFIPILLEDFEIVAVTAYLQAMDNPTDTSKVTALDDWENYFGKKLTMLPSRIPSAPTEAERLKRKLDNLALSDDSPDEIVEKMICFACHKIPGIAIAKTGKLGPQLIMKTNAEIRIKSAEYQKAVREGRAHAMTPREYVIESIVDPGAFIIPGFVDGMVKDYRHKFTLQALDTLVDFLMTQGDEEARKEALEHLSNEN